MYTLISKEGNVRRITDSERTRDELLRMGYRLAKDTEQGEPKPRKRTSQSTAAKKADADKE